MGRYAVIGENQVAAPTHLFKAVLAEERDDDAAGAGPRRRAVAAWVMPNRPIDEQLPLSAYQVPLEEVEARGGLELFPALDRGSADDLGALPEARFGTNGRAEQWRRFGLLKTAKSRAELDAAWRAAEPGFQGEPDWVPKMYRREYDATMKRIAVPHESAADTEPVVIPALVTLGLAAAMASVWGRIA